VVAALYSGVALVILVVAGFRRAYHLEQFITERHFVRLGFILAAFAAAYLYLTFADILPDAYVGERDTTAVFQLLLIGRFAPYFWTFVVAAGLLPLLLVAIPRTRTVPGMVTAAAFVVPAMWLKRMIMVTGPATYDRITSAFGAYHFTWTYISITLAATAAVPLLLMLLFRAVPLLSIDEIEEIEVVQEHMPEQPQPAQPEPAAAQAPAQPVTSSLLPASRAANGKSRRRWVVHRATAAGLLVLAAAGLSLAAARPALAAQAGPKPAVIQVTGTDGARGVHLTVTLTDAHGKPIVGATVAFSELTKEFGPKGELVPLGTAVTSRSGIARLTDRPAVTGTQRFVAAYTGGPQAKAASAGINVKVTTAYSPFQPSPPKPFTGIGKVLVGVLLSAVTLILLTLIIQVERVRRACRAGL
jgi:hypothetical protein